MEFRDIEIFLTLADELHFGRTAERLHVSPARISQAIKKQERAVGADLFTRTSRSVRLTLVGEQLRDDLRPVYRGLHESLSRARLRAQGKTSVLTVGMMTTNAHDLRLFWETFRSRNPQWGLRIQSTGFVDPFVPLRDGDVDALVWFLPIEEPDLTVGPVLYIEPKMLAVSTKNRLAEEKTVSLEVFGDFPALTVNGTLPEASEHEFIPFYTPKGRSVEKVISVQTSDDIYNAVSQDEAIHGVAAYAVRYHARPDVAYIPIANVAPLAWVLVWRSDSDDERLRALADVITELGPATG
ncbi:LysR substrate-binding domain-containing protein [Nocardia tengchongensis]|uniref:LysR substrate-binding domain-containing protein n=1 Tax=Nocardia tengchongensis TaxID=2055889 RepID=UPI0036B293BD